MPWDGFDKGPAFFDPRFGPNIDVELDPWHPAAASFLDGAYFGSFPSVTLAGNPITYSGNAPAGLGAMGRGVETAVTGSKHIEWALSKLETGTNRTFQNSWPYAILLVFETLTASTSWSNYSRLFELGGGNPSVEVNGTTDAWYFLQSYYGGGTPTLVNLVSKPSDFLLKPSALLLTWEGTVGGANGTLHEFMNGRYLQATACAAPGGNSSSMVRLGTQYAFSRFMDARFYGMALFWATNFPLALGIELTARPFDWLRPISPRGIPRAGTSPPPPPPSNTNYLMPMLGVGDD